MAASKKTAGTTVAPNKKAKSPLKEQPNGKSPIVATPPASISPKSPSPIKPKAKAPKSKKSKKAFNASSSSFFDRIIRVALISFAAYCLVVCPGDNHLANPTCKKVFEVRTRLEPYVVLPVRAIAAHPSVAPYVAAAKPHFEHAVKFSTPYYERVRDEIVPRLTVLARKVAPYVEPAVHRVQAEYHVNIRPHVVKLQGHLEPYVHKIERYLRRVEPYSRRAVKELEKAYKVALPHIERAVLFGREKWLEIQPRIIPVLEQAKELPQWVIVRVGPLLSDLKSTYVEPQLKKIWAKIEELSSDRSAKNSFGGASTITSFTQTTSKSTSRTSTAISSSVASVASSTVTPVTSSVESVLAEVIPTFEETPAATTESIEAETEIESVFHTPEAPIPTPAEADIDVEEFLESLESTTAAEAEPEASAIEEPEVESTPAVDEEAVREAKRVETAEKRAAVEARHAEWEDKVERQGKQGAEELIASITAIRQKAVDAIKAEGGEIGAQVAAFKAEGAKAIKGTEAYSHKLMAGHYGGAEKVGLYGHVVEKVRKRYGEGASAISTKIAEWWADIRAEVEEEAGRLGTVVEDIAGDAQANLGMDYAWLDDVATSDWTRYHDLVRTAKAFSAEYLAIAAGTHDKSPEDPLPPVLAELQTELQDVLITFEAELTATHREGLRLFVGKQTTDQQGSSPKKQPTFSILPVAEARDDYDPSVIIGRGKEEVAEALSRAAEAGETVKEKARTTKSSFDEVTDSILDDIFNNAESLYESGAEGVREAKGDAQKILDDSQATESLKKVHTKVAEYAASIRSEAASLASSVSESVTSTTDKISSVVAKPSHTLVAEYAASIRSELSESLASATEKVESTAKPKHTLVAEYAASIRSEALASASSLASEASETISSATEVTSSVVAKPRHTLVAEYAASIRNEVKSKLSENVEIVTEATPSHTLVAEYAASLRSRATDIESSLRSEASGSIISVAEKVSSVVVGEPTSTPSNIVESASSIVEDAATKVAGGTRDEL